jgi:hypothetical protein
MPAARASLIADGVVLSDRPASIEHMFEDVVVLGSRAEGSPVGEPWSTYLPDGLPGDILSVADGGSSWEHLGGVQARVLAGAGSQTPGQIRRRSHHRLKAGPGWALTRKPSGTVVWHTPTRHAYEREPGPVGEIARAQASSGPA